MKVLLVQPPHISGGISRVPDAFPLSLAYIAKPLMKKHDVEVLDIWACGYDNSEVKEIIRQKDFDAVGISALCTQYSYVKWISKEIKSIKDKPVVLGGLLATNSTDIVLKNTEVDICILGEGEETIVDLLDNLDELDEVEGIAYKDRGEIIRNKPRGLISDLDDIEFPAWELFPAETYITSSTYMDEGRQMSVVVGRGCPYRCTYCSRSFDNVRYRSVDNVISEIKELIKRYNIQTVRFADELIVVNKKRTSELCDKIKPLGIKWTCQGRVNTVDYTLLTKMKESGCIRIGYGIESGSQKILDIMNKRVTIKQAEEAIAATRRAGIELWPQFMFGMVGETKDTIRETIDFCKRNHLSVPGMSPATPLPNTWLYDHAMKKGMIEDEEKYLEGLPGTFKLYMNMTDMDDDQYLELKDSAIHEINDAYIKYRRFHPSLLYKDYSFKLKKAVSYARKKGLVNLFKGLYNSLRKDPRSLFYGELR